MLRSKRSVLAAAAAAGVIAVSLATPAAADPVPQPRDIVGGGSDTTQYAMQYIADGALVSGSLRSGYNYSASNRLVSFDAIRELTGQANTVYTHNADEGIHAGDLTYVRDMITLKAGTVPVPRPNGSTDGKNLLHGTANNAAANYARSSSALSAAEVADGLWAVPFAKDGIQLAVRDTALGGSSAPATITPTQMLRIYEGAVTNWSEIGGANAPVIALIPQNSSGTRTTFTAQLQAIKTGLGEGVFTMRVDAVEVQEHDSSYFVSGANPQNAVAPFSTGRAGLPQNVGNVDLIQGAGSWAYTRALYNVVRNADRTQPWFTQLFGPNGYICSGSATSLIAASGFTQLSGPLDGGVCGVATQAATTNFN